MKDMKRALRRHHLLRLKKARRWYYGRDLWLSPEEIGKVVRSARLCSCWMCGNRRKYFGLSVQERRWVNVD